MLCALVEILGEPYCVVLADVLFAMVIEVMMKICAIIVLRQTIRSGAMRKLCDDMIVDGSVMQTCAVSADCMNIYASWEAS